MPNIREKAISILAGNLNLGGSYLITTVTSGTLFILKKMASLGVWKEMAIPLKKAMPQWLIIA